MADKKTMKSEPIEEVRNLTKREIMALRNQYAKTAYTLAGTPARVMEATDGELGYTKCETKRCLIYLAFQHEMYNSMTVPERLLCIKGVYTHELMHRLATDLQLYQNAIKTISPSPATQNIMATLLNIMEDASIEYIAPWYVSDEYIRALDYMRGICFAQAPNLQDHAETAWDQFVCASIQYGDGGCLKGNFTFPEAEKAFADALPIMNRCTLCRSQAKRIEYVKEVMELTKPLWEPLAKRADAMEEMMKRLAEMMGATGHGSPGSGDGVGSHSSGSSDEDDEEESDEDAEARSEARGRVIRRKATTESTSAREEKTDDADGSDDSEDADNDDDITVRTGKGKKAAKESDEENGDKDSSGHGDEEDSDAPDTKEGADKDTGDKDDADSDDSDDGTSDDEGEDGEENEDNASKSDTSSTHDSSDTSKPDKADKSSHVEKGGCKGHSESLEDEAEESLEEELYLDPDEIAALADELDTAIDEYEASDDADTSFDLIDMDLPVGSGYRDLCKNKACLNKRVSVASSEALFDKYQEVRDTMSDGIDLLTRQLEKIFRQKQEEVIYRTSGKLSMKRLSSGRLTTRVFSKKRMPGGSDVAIAIAVDISGSMQGTKVKNARNCAIGLAEVCGKLKIPVYVFGFSADENSSGEWCSSHEKNFPAVHYHYINWSNRPSERLALLSMDAQCNNFDGYSIRYAAQLLKKHPATTKLLFVISDGAPCCQSYNASDSGIMDTKLAVQEAAKVAKVFGILLESSNTELHRQMYGYNFINCANSNELFLKLGKQIAAALAQ